MRVISEETSVINKIYWYGSFGYSKVRSNTPAKPMLTPVGTLKSSGFFIAWSMA